VAPSVGFRSEEWEYMRNPGRERPGGIFVVPQQILNGKLGERTVEWQFPFTLSLSLMESVYSLL